MPIYSLNQPTYQQNATQVTTTNNVNPVTALSSNAVSGPPCRLIPLWDSRRMVFVSPDSISCIQIPVITPQNQSSVLARVAKVMSV
ncbi:hypothetical protein HK098_003870 [Nowakowskiella sp. JEL0407]|nr:hypothetical protein HK098_003870 [Nowakowskiella sp. JEL0407]